MRVNKAAEQRAQRAIKQANTFAAIKPKSLPVDRTEALSTVNHRKIRG